MKLGRNAAQFDNAVPKLSNLLKAPAPLPPTEMKFKQISWWPMLLNDMLGDCTVAGITHVWQYWKEIGDPSIFFIMSDDEAKAHYSAITGYVDGDDSTDNGAVELNVLNYFKTAKMIHSTPCNLTKFISIDYTDIEQVKYSTANLGNCYIGVNLPQSALQTNLWDVVAGSPIEGGHCVNIVGYDDPNQLLYIVSWGTVVPMTYRFFQTYCEESWSLYSLDWITQSGVGVTHFDHQA